MSRGGQVGSAYILALPQTRKCRCDRSVPMEDGRCVKCGHQAEPRPVDSTTRVTARALAKILAKQ